MIFLNGVRNMEYAPDDTLNDEPEPDQSELLPLCDNCGEPNELSPYNGMMFCKECIEAYKNE